jgi:transcriptional regulator with XRE-family HTH domain
MQMQKEKFHQVRRRKNEGGLMALDTFGKRLRVLRVDKALSQTELRDKMEKLAGVKIGETYISELERTDKMPSLEVAAAMAKVLDVSLDYLGLLIEDAEQSYRRAPTPASYFSEEADEVAQLVDRMSAQQRSVVVSVARNLSVLTTERARRQAEFKELLASIERDLGLDARKAFERILRNKGLYIDNS